jgi:uncharacterized protein
MVNNTVFNKIRKQTAQYYKHSHHDKHHIERVYNLALRIAQQEKADTDTVKAAVLLHDIARAMEDEGTITDHANEGAKMAKKILTEINFPANKIDNVVHCIETHRFRKRLTPKTLEAQILQDADRLDIIGAIGIARTFTRGGWSNTPIHDSKNKPKAQYDGKSETSTNHIQEKLLKIKDTINTKTAKKIADERHTYVEQFLKRLLREWKAEI